MKIKTKNYKPKVGEEGFSLIELLTALVIGIIVIVLVSDIFAQTLRMQRRAFFVQKVQENISLILEAMVKEIRVSTISTANTNCPTAPAQLLNISHPVNGNIEYSLSPDNNIYRRINDSGIDTILNSSDITINSLGFCISGNSVDDNLQPRVTILLSVQNKNGSEAYPIERQTTVSQRLLSN